LNIFFNGIGLRKPQNDAATGEGIGQHSNWYLWLFGDN